MCDDEVIIAMLLHLLQLIPTSAIIFVLNRYSFDRTICSYIFLPLGEAFHCGILLSLYPGPNLHDILICLRPQLAKACILGCFQEVEIRVLIFIPQGAEALQLLLLLPSLLLRTAPSPPPLHRLCTVPTLATANTAASGAHADAVCKEMKLALEGLPPEPYRSQPPPVPQVSARQCP